MERLVKTIKIIILASAFISSNYSYALGTSTPPNSSIEVRGTLQRYLMNPRGKIDGLILSDGTQVNFPAHMSAKLSTIASPSDEIIVKGFRENKNVFSAESMINTKTNRTIGASAPYLSLSEQEELYGNPIPQQNERVNNHIGMKQLSVTGTIQTQLFDRHGQVSGVILSDDSIVHFGNHSEDQANVYVDVGETLSASGYGTENALGKTLEADKLSNK